MTAGVGPSLTREDIAEAFDIPVEWLPQEPRGTWTMASDRQQWARAQVEPWIEYIAQLIAANLERKTRAAVQLHRSRRHKGRL